MTSLTSTKISARKRREVAETARLRMAALLPAAEGPVGAEETTTTGPPAGGSAESSIEALSEQPPGSPAASSSGPSSELPFGVLPGGPAGEVAGGAVAAGAVAEGGPDDDAPDRVPFRLGPAVMLDRRAVVGLAVLLLLAVGYGVQHFWLARPQPVDVPAMAVASAEPGLASRAGPKPPPARLRPVRAVRTQAPWWSSTSAAGCTRPACTPSPAAPGWPTPSAWPAARCPRRRPRTSTWQGC